MDVDEFLNGKANKGKKQDLESDNVENQRKRQKLTTTDHLNEEEKIRILKMLESEPEREAFTENQLKKLLNQLEKRVYFCFILKIM